jgi:zinc protease
VRFELQRVKTQYAAGFIRGVDRIGGFGGKSDVLARGQAFLDDPGFYKIQLQRVQDASVQDLKSAARRWLSDGVYTLEVHPYPSYKTATESVDRSKAPQTSDGPVRTRSGLRKNPEHKCKRGCSPPLHGEPQG